MIDNDKIGSYIKELRTKHNLTQEELADTIHVSRQAVSNWETGKDAPSIDNVNSICILFNASMADIYAGEEIKDIKTLNDVIHSLVTIEIKKSKKIMILASIIIFILVVLFLAYYFITYYNNITSYLINAETSNYDINGIMNKSVDNMYFNLEVDSNPEKMCLLYNDKELLCKSNSNYLIINESNGYNEIMPLDKNSFNDYIANMFVTIQKDGKTDKYKLNINEVYKNSNLFKENNEEITKNDDDYKLEDIVIPDKIKKEFKYNDEEKHYYLVKKENDKQLTMYYFNEIGTFNIIEKYNDYTIKYNYNIAVDNILSYDYSDNLNDKIVKTYNNINKDDKDKNRKEIYNYFKQNYVDKYLN